jgi:hypothetical protein
MIDNSARCADGKAPLHPVDPGSLAVHESDNELRGRHDERLTGEVLEAGWTEENKLRRREGGPTEHNVACNGEQTCSAHLKSSLVRYLFLCFENFSLIHVAFAPLCHPYRLSSSDSAICVGRVPAPCSRRLEDIHCAPY